MKYKIVILVCIISILFLASVLLCSCGFVAFYSDEEFEESEIDKLKSDYINALSKEDAESKYYYDEYKEYLLLLNESINYLNDCTNINDLERAFDECKKSIAQIKTISQYQKEALDLKISKDDFITKLEEVITDMSVYREAQKEEITEHIFVAKRLIADANSIEDVELLFNQYKERLLLIKTDSQMYKIECKELCDNYYKKWNGIINDCSLDNGMVASSSLYYVEMCELKTKEEINSYYNEKSIALFSDVANEYDKALSLLKEIYISKVSNYDKQLYVEEELESITNEVSKTISLISSACDYAAIAGAYIDFNSFLDGKRKNDVYWNKMDEEFVLYMQEKYGAMLLPMPVSLVSAKNRQELANIIDYYAFYQLEDHTFERTKFRVKLEYERNESAQYEYNEAYWYTELMKSSVDAKCWYETDYLMIELISYNTATISNKDKVGSVNRVPTAFEYRSAATNNRDAEYSDFEYLDYSQNVLVWNSQQLWYVLEKEYRPVCKAGSIAEQCLDAAKNILKTIIKSDMTELEKLYQIYAWFGKNVQYDYSAYDYNISSNMDLYPSESVSLLRSCYVEGALIDNLAICSGYAKGALVLLKIEGLNARHVLTRGNSMRGINSINTRDYNGGWFGYHEFIYVTINGYNYYFDVEKSFAEANANIVSIISLLLSPNMYESGFSSVFYEDIASDYCIDAYSNIVLNDTSIYITEIDQIQSHIDYFSILSGSVSASIIVRDDIYQSVKDRINASGISTITVRKNNTNYALYEIIMYK